MKDEYIYIPGFKNTKNKPVLGRDVTTCIGKRVADKLLTEQQIANMNFPRLRMPLFRGLGYSAEDYRKIANFIYEKEIRVYEAKESEDLNFLGVYNTLNYFVFSPKLTGALDTYIGTIVHEATHAIQDLKRWRESNADREVDAHFATALFMVLSDREQLLQASRYKDFIDLAKIIKGDSDYYKKFEFRKKVRDLQNKITTEYNWQWKDNIDEITKFQKKERWDGIGI